MKIASLPMVVVATVLLGPIGFLFSTAISILILIVYAVNPGGGQLKFDVRIKVPTCAGCREKDFRPLAVSWENASMKIVVHPDFAKRIPDQS